MAGSLPTRSPTVLKGLSLPKGCLLKPHCSGWIYLIFDTKKYTADIWKFYFMRQRISADVIVLSLACCSLGSHMHTHTHTKLQ